MFRGVYPASLLKQPVGCTFSPLPAGERGRGRGPKPQTSTEHLTGLITLALSLTLSPEGRGNCSGVSAAPELGENLFLPRRLSHYLPIQRAKPQRLHHLVAFRVLQPG